jgi:iron complex outermembrane receptor protein|tara:strand:+ start:1208 stop:3223 length:2016 start_codon:yes stop_codon:yes gene_type:complete
MALGTANVLSAEQRLISTQTVLTEDDLLVEIPMVQGPTHMTQTLAQTPASVTILDRQTIQASAAVGVIDLFRLVPGFQTYFVDGSRMGTTYHALGDEYPRRLEVKVDGRSVYESIFSAVDWSVIGVTLDDIEYVEIVRGANASADGSNAFLASINIVTRSPLADSGWSINSQLGTGDVRNANLAYTGTLGPVNHRTTLSIRSNDGFDDSFDQGAPVIAEDSSENFSGTFRGLWTPNASDSLEFQAGISESNLGIGERDYIKRKVSYKYQYVNWSRLMSSGSKLQMLLYHNDMDTIDQVAPLFLSEALGIPDTSPNWPLPGLPDKLVVDETDRSESERWDLELRGILNPLENLRAVTGVAVRHDRVQGQELFDRPDSLSETSHRAYTNLEWTSSDRLVINAGLVLEKKDSADSYFSYRLAGNYQLHPEHIVRVAFNRSFRSPTLLESQQQQFVRYNENIILDASVISDADINNERLRSLEVGYLGYLFDRTLSFDMRLFREQLTDVISERRSSYPDLDNFVNIRDNTDKFNVDGFEIQTHYRPNDRFLLRGHYSYSDIDGETLYRSAPVLEIRDLGIHGLKHGAGLLTSYAFDRGVTLSSMVSYRSATRHYLGTNVENHTRIDLKASRRWSINNSDIDLSLVVQNAGEPYSEFRNYNQFKTQYVLGLKVSMP